MVQIENKNWDQVGRDLFMMPYAGHIVVHSLSGEELSEQEQRLAASQLAQTFSGLHKVSLGMDPFLPRLMLNLRLGASSNIDAMKLLCTSVIQAWETAGKDIEDLELVEAHLVYEPQLQEDLQTDSTADVSDVRYIITEVELPELDVFDSPVFIDTREVFGEARDGARA
jgi:hypothetical protein